MSEPATGADGEAELEAFRRAGHALEEGVADQLVALLSGPVWRPLPDAWREQLLDVPLPARGGKLDDLVATAVRVVLPYAMGNGHPAFFGWVNPPPADRASGAVPALLVGSAGTVNAGVIGPTRGARRRRTAEGLWC